MATCDRSAAKGHATNFAIEFKVCRLDVEQCEDLNVFNRKVDNPDQDIPTTLPESWICHKSICLIRVSVHLHACVGAVSFLAKKNGCFGSATKLVGLIPCVRCVVRTVPFLAGCWAHDEWTSQPQRLMLCVSRMEFNDVKCFTTARSVGRFALAQSEKGRCATSGFHSDHLGRRGCTSIDNRSRETPIQQRHATDLPIHEGGARLCSTPGSTGLRWSGRKFLRQVQAWVRRRPSRRRGSPPGGRGGSRGPLPACRHREFGRSCCTWPARRSSPSAAPPPRPPAFFLSLARTLPTLKP